MKRVHLIDDDPLVLWALDVLLEIEGFPTTTHDSALGFLSTDEAKSAGCVVTDIEMPGMSGLELVAEMSNRGIDCPVIMMTGYRSTEKKRRASELGVVDYLEKPVKSDDLVAGLKKALAPPMP